jgi:hypothetical protein
VRLRPQLGALRGGLVRSRLRHLQMDRVIGTGIRTEAWSQSYDEFTIVVG